MKMLAMNLKHPARCSVVISGMSIRNPMFHDDYGGSSDEYEEEEDQPMQESAIAGSAWWKYNIKWFTKWNKIELPCT